MIQKLLAKSFLFNLFALARFSHAKKYLLKVCRGRPDAYTTFVLAKDKQKSLCIWAIQQVKHRKKHVSDDLYLWELGGEMWLANLDHIHGLHEYLVEGFDAQYLCDYIGKVVLDIGGYIGDTARYFLKNGARKVVVYEPINKNVACLNFNLAQMPVEVIPKGVGSQNGKVTIQSNYPPGHIGFGNLEGRYSASFEVESFSTLLSKIQADIVKVDCEGNEKYLLEVDPSLLRKIPYWMIEVHSHRLTLQLENLFLRAGFEQKAVRKLSGHVGVYHYSL